MVTKLINLHKNKYIITEKHTKKICYLDILQVESPFLISKLSATPNYIRKTQSHHKLNGSIVEISIKNSATFKQFFYKNQTENNLLSIL